MTGRGAAGTGTGSRSISTVTTPEPVARRSALPRQSSASMGSSRAVAVRALLPTRQGGARASSIAAPAHATGKGKDRAVEGAATEDAEPITDAVEAPAARSRSPMQQSSERPSPDETPYAATSPPSTTPPSPRINPERDPPTARQTLMRVVQSFPRRPTQEEFREARARVKALDALNDTAVVRVLAASAIRAQLDTHALRLAHECAKLVEKRRPADSLPGRVAMYEHLVAAVQRTGRWDSVITFTNDALALGIVSYFLLSRRIRALHERERYGDVAIAFNLLVQHGFEPKDFDYDEMISAHLLNGDLSKAQDLLAEKVKKGLRTTTQTCLALIGGMVPYGGNRVMEERLLMQATPEDLDARKAMRQDQRVLNKVLSVRAARGALGDALAIIHYFDFGRYPPEVVEGYLALAPGTALPASATEPHWRPRPDVATIVTLVGIALREQQPQLARLLLVSSLQAKIHFNEFFVAAVVRVLLAEHKLDTAATFVEAVSTGTASLGGQVLPALEPCVKVHELLFAGMLRYRGIPGANKCFERLTTTSGRRMQVSMGMTRALVDHLALDADVATGVSADVLMKIKQFTEKKTRPTVGHLNTLLRAAWMRERRWQYDLDGPEQPVEEEFPMPDEPLPVDRAPRPARSPPRPRPSAYVPREAELLVPTGGRHETSVSRLRTTLADRGRHDAETTRHVLRNDYLIRYVEAKWEYLQSHVVDLGIRPNFHHISILMRAYLRLGDPKGARLAMQYATDELGLDPHPAYHTTLIGGLARLGEYGAAADVYAEFKATGLPHDRNLFAALAMLYARQRDVQGVERVFALVQEHARSRQSAPQLQAQALRLTGAVGRTGGGHGDGGRGLPSTILTPYDPTLDALFLTIMYRTLVSTAQHRAAQELVADSLRRGLVPDRLLLQALLRTRTWIQWKTNAVERVGAVRTSAPGGGGDEATLSVDELLEIKHLNALNITHTRKMLRRMRPVVEKKELKGMLDYWQRAEKDPMAYGERSGRRREEDDDGGQERWAEQLSHTQ